MELEAFLEEVHFLWQSFSISLECVQDEKLRDKVDEDESSCAGAESHMRACWLQLETTSHWTLDVVHLIRAELLLYVSSHRVDIVRWDRSLVNARCKTHWRTKLDRSIVSLECQVNLSLILSKHHRVVKVANLSCNDSVC